MNKEIKQIYEVMLKAYKKDPYWSNWDLIEEGGKVGWKHGPWFNAIRANYGRFIEKYWIYKT